MSQTKKLSASDIMTKDVLTCDQNEDLSRIAAEMGRKNVGSIVITEKRDIIGILTERDFVRIVESTGILLAKNRAKHHMSKPVLTAPSTASVADIVKIMRQNHVRHVVIVGTNGELAGIISSRDLLKARVEVPT
jgi:CBS domain-containing protein